MAGCSGMDYTRIYCPLDKSEREVRLLQVQPEHDGKVSLHLDAYALDPLLDYIALSYCWTEEPPTREIILQGCPFFVRPNLHEYLKVLSEERESSLIFIDALCINQADEDEKTNQVGLMREIYSNAREVVAWMGLAGSKKNRGFLDSMLPELEELFESEKLQEAVFDGNSHPTLQKACIIAFLSYEFWSRVWITQEIILAKSLVLRYRRLRFPAHLLQRVLIMNEKRGEPNTPDMLTKMSITHGKISLRLGGMDRAHTSLQRQNRILEDRNIYLKARLVSNTISALFFYQPAFHVVKHGRPTMSMLAAMHMSRAQECSRPHDTIFGVLGLTDSVLVPGYNIPMILLYLRVLVEGLLEFRAGFMSEMYDLRSVPDLRSLVSYLLIKMQLSALHLTTALITIYALGICNTQLSLSIWDSTSWSGFRNPNARFRAVPLFLRLCYMSNRSMRAEGETKPFTMQGITATEFPYNHWTKYILSVSREIAGEMRSRRGMDIGALNESFCITDMKLW